MERTRILVVEDEDDLCDTLAEVLKEEGFDVHVSRGLNDARVAYATLSPTTVLADVRLHGETTESWVREISVNSRVIVMSATPTFRRMAEACGASFVAKPFELDDLLRAIAT